jgi:hypothetical protein
MPGSGTWRLPSELVQDKVASDVAKLSQSAQELIRLAIPTVNHPDIKDEYLENVGFDAAHVIFSLLDGFGSALMRAPEGTRIMLIHELERALGDLSKVKDT